ncbi:MAG: hypothetical protein ABJR05_09535 [Balneola sp.]
MKSIFLSVFTCLMFFSTNVLAQEDEGNSGTVYSKYGTGFPLLNNTAQEKAMGIIGISFNDLGSPGLSNPAFWGIGAFSKIAANFDFANYSVKDSFSNGSNSLLKIGSFQAVFPLSKNQLGLSIGLYPETRSSYNVNSEETVIQGGSNINFLSNRTGTGGVTKFEVGLGWKINQRISLGYAPSYSFLTESEDASLTFLNQNISNNTVNRRINGTSVSHRFGLLLSERGIFGKEDIIQIGGTLTLPTNFDASQKKTTTKIVGTESEVVEIGTAQNADISLPLKMGAGISYFPNSKFNASVEFQTEKWSEAEYGFSSSDESAFVDRNVFGLGFQYHPYKDRSSKFLSNFKYSAGVSYDTGHIKVNNEEVETLWLSAGLGLISPNLRSNSSFDLSFQYGFRGTTSQNLVEERIFGINLSVNLTELMFLRRKLN